MTERNYGIDLFRIYSMLLVIIVHIVGHGGILSATVPGTVNYETARLLDIFSVCAVNCFALISGYVGYSSRFRLSNILYLWLQVAFYSFLITLVWHFIRPEQVNLNAVLTSLLPVSFRQYWYFTAYFCLFFLMPAINLVVRQSSDRFLFCFSAALLFLFSLLPMLTGSDLFHTGRGYAPLWLAVMYYFGAVCKKTSVLDRFSGKNSLLIFFGCIVLAWGVKRLIEITDITVIRKYMYREFMVSYTGITTVAEALMLLSWFSKRKPKRTKWIRFICPLVFGVYLVHVHPLPFESLFRNAFAFLAGLNPALLILGTFACAVAVFCVCAAVDWIRLQLFRLLRIPKLCSGIENRFRSLLDKGSASSPIE